jgi:hypothetical protein
MYRRTEISVTRTARMSVLAPLAIALCSAASMAFAQGKPPSGSNLATQVADHETRLGTLEGQNLDNRVSNNEVRLGLIEGQNLGTRLGTIEGQDLDGRVSALEGALPQFPVQEGFVKFEECFDLETGQVIVGPGVQCMFKPDGDINFAFNSAVQTPTSLFWPGQFVDVARLPGLPFSAVNASILDHPIVFEGSVTAAPPFTGTDTALVRTGAGNVYKVGFAICMTINPATYPGCAAVSDPDAGGVRFHFQQLQ